jgi:hypothetical protein
MEYDVHRSQRNSAYAVLEDKMNYFPVAHRPQLSDWSESGPSTPTKRPKPPHEENWDDYFEDSTRKPSSRIPENTRRYPGTPSRAKRYHQHSPSEAVENWDDESDTKKPEKAAGFSPSKRARHDPFPESSDDEAELSFVDKDEDHTVTARSHHRSSLFKGFPPPHPPALPNGTATIMEIDSRSSTGSIFSIPVSSGTGLDSVAHSSTSHLALNPTTSFASSAYSLSTSPPVHRERRRLRKKSRPQQVDETVLDMHDRGRISSPSSSPQPASSPERASSPPVTTDVPAPPSPKPPLLSRISSVKKWGVRRKRTSTSPPEAVSDGLDNIAQSLPATKGTSWFFRSASSGSGSAPPQPDLMHSKSVEKLRHSDPSTNPVEASMADTGRNSPTKLSKRKSLGFVNLRPRDPAHGCEEGTFLPTQSEPIPLQPNASTRRVSYSYGIPTSVSTPTPVVRSEKQASSACLPPAEDLSGSGTQREGHRSFLGGVRRLSLVGMPKKHKRTKSSGAADLVPSLSGFVPTPPRVSPAELCSVQARASEEGKSLMLIELRQLMDCGIDDGLPTSKSVPVMPSDHIESIPIVLGSKGTPPHSRTKTQIASLGRSTSPTTTATVAVPRRNSLGDLKIPSRISQAQVGLRRDLGMVREFAANVEREF